MSLHPFSSKENIFISCEDERKIYLKYLPSETSAFAYLSSNKRNLFLSEESVHIANSEFLHKNQNATQTLLRPSALREANGDLIDQHF